MAIKVLLPNLSGNRQFTELFLKEAEIVAKFGHPNIVQVYAIHMVQGIYFIVMEYVEGITLRDKIRREGRISEETTLRIMDQVTRALAESHACGIIHRDIKPQKILLTKEGIPKVADFGLAVSARESQQGRSATAGTPTYMSPEQARGDAPTPASDIYSLGVVMYFMLTGRIPCNRCCGRYQRETGSILPKRRPNYHPRSLKWSASPWNPWPLDVFSP